MKGKVIKYEQDNIDTDVILDMDLVELRPYLCYLVRIL